MSALASALARRGIFFGWWVVIASGTTLFLTAGTFFYGFSTLFNPIVAEFGWSRASISLAFSLRSNLGGVAAPLVGYLVDRKGSRRLMIAGVLIVATGFALMSQMQSLLWFYGSVLVIAVGMSATGGAVGTTAVAHWFDRRRGRALSYMAMGTGTSGVMVLVLEFLISSFGWREALLVIAGAQLLICLPMAWSIQDYPADIGLQPDGEPRPPPQADGGDPPTPVREGMTVREALRSSAFWKMASSIGLVNIGLIAIIVHLIPFLTGSLDFTDGQAAAAFTAMILLSLIGRFAVGQLADRIDTKFVLAGACAFAGASLVLFATSYEPWQIAYALPVYAFGWGGLLPIRAAFQADYFGTKAFGAIQGLVFTVAQVGGLIGPVFAGLMFDETDSYRLAFLILSAGALISVPLALSITPPVPAADGT